MEISKAAEALLAALETTGGGRAKVELDAIQTAFLNAFPQWQGNADRRERLRTLLDELAAAQRVRLPGDPRRGWERVPSPALPQWALLTRNVAPLPPPFDHRSFPWVQELTFVSGLRAVVNADELRRIHDFLKDHPERRPIVPVKERSFQLFGDEKRLDALRKSQLFEPDRLTLELMRCQDVPASLPCVPSPRPSTGAWLILENEATFHSFARLNRVLALHAGVILGSGLNVLRAVDFLRTLSGTNIHPAAAGFDYFGDIDRDGIEIPAELDRRLHDRNLPGARPACRYYEWLIETRPAPTAPSLTSDPTFPALEWFPENLRLKVASALQSKPLVQEAIGWEFLCIRFGISAEIPFT